MALKKKLMFLHLSISGPCLARLRLISRDEQKKERDAGGKRFVLFPPFFCLLKILIFLSFPFSFLLVFSSGEEKQNQTKKRTLFFPSLLVREGRGIV